MKVIGRIRVVVFDFDVLAVSGTSAGRDHRSVACGVDVRAPGRAVIDSPMRLVPMLYGVETPAAEIRGHTCVPERSAPERFL